MKTEVKKEVKTKKVVFFQGEFIEKIKSYRNSNYNEEMGTYISNEFSEIENHIVNGLRELRDDLDLKMKDFKRDNNLIDGDCSINYSLLVKNNTFSLCSELRF